MGKLDTLRTQNAASSPHEILPSLLGPNTVPPEEDATVGWPLFSALGDTEQARSILEPLLMKDSRWLRAHLARHLRASRCGVPPRDQHQASLVSFLPGGDSVCPPDKTHWKVCVTAPFSTTQSSQV